jgi:ribosomal protein S1
VLAEGQRVKVTVLQVDAERHRIGLRLDHID